MFPVGGVSRRPNRPQIATEISCFTGSNQALDRARSWLDTCVTYHNCSHGTVGKLPTRVLFIEKYNQVRLHVSEGESAPYICLSHCWGNDSLSILRTTDATLEDFQNSIPWEDLPNTFRDAIQFTYRLGLRYLWIDSLCIIQDSIVDWRHEGSLMASIYENAYVTLAATNAPGPTKGCFSTAAEEYRARSISFTTESNGGSSREDHTIYVRTSLIHNELANPLLNRGWVRTLLDPSELYGVLTTLKVLQERILSPRIIHFAEQELRWECNHSSLCECSVTARHFPGFRKTKLTTLTRDLWHTAWLKIIRDYTGKSLTHSSDIFPALQGLAKKGSPFLGNYLAGLWEDTLVYDLMWFADPGRPLLPRPQSWRAPTWSWASIAGAVRFPDDSLQRPDTFATMVSAATTAAGDDNTGELSDAWLVIKGMCMTGSFQLWQDDTSESPTCVSVPVIATPSRPDLNSIHIPNDTLWIRENDMDLVVIAAFDCDYTFDAPGPYHVPVGTKVVLMKIDETYEVDILQRTRGWLVLRETNVEKKIYERIGVLRMPLVNSKTAFMERWFKTSAKEMEVMIV
jgi:hypothetical protein